jgi:Clp amino terminal domain, pathogenicity island component
MFERFSAPARRVLVIAQQEAHGFGHDFIGTEHLLLGVAVQEDQWGALMLARRGLTATRIRSEIERIIGRAPGDALLRQHSMVGYVSKPGSRAPAQLPGATVVCADPDSSARTIGPCPRADIGHHWLSYLPTG